MCGIAGELASAGRSADLNRLDRTAEQLGPRGPDGRGLWAHQAVALAHRRLKIIDLSEQAAQPMVDPDLGLTLVYNGAIYNYPELRRELEGLGYRFFSTGDTEVVLKGFHAWGRRVVERLQGMFAFAIYERATGRLTLGRDRLGIKPLYYTTEGGAFRFASSLPALVKGGDVSAAIDPVALHHYFTFHSVVPPPRTILAGVSKLPPATTMVVEPDGQRDLETYWTLAYPETCEPLDEQAWQERVMDALDRAVQRRLVADVPVGVLLSGGLDSSLIVGLLARHGQAGLNTFSIGFESAGGEKGDEFQYSDIVAERFQTNHHQIFVSSSQVLPNLERCVRAMSEPMVSHDNIGFFLLSAEVAKHVKVVQSGQGADEVFGGYHWYPPMMDAEDALASYEKAFFDRDHREYAQLVHPRFVGEDHSRRFVAEQFDRPGAPHPIQKALRLDTTVMLVDDPVKRVDNMTMAWGLEARVPFLDHELVEVAAQVPSELKIRDGGKYVLKEAARKVIPSEVIDRPKGYFPVPALKYISGPYLDFVQGVLGAPEAKARGLVQTDAVAELLDDPPAHITPLRGSKLWQVALLEYWLQVHEL